MSDHLPNMLVIEAAVPESLAVLVDRQYRVAKGHEPTLEQFLFVGIGNGIADDYSQQLRAINRMLAEGITRWRASFLVTATAEQLRYVLGHSADLPIFERPDGDGKIRLMLNGLATGAESPRFRFERWKGDINTEAVMLHGTDDMAERIPHEVLREALLSLVKNDGAAAWELIARDFVDRTAYKK